MRNTFRTVVTAAAALMISTQANAQVFFQDDFNTGGTAGAVSRGWEFIMNEFVTETGVEFVVAPEWPEGQDGPGTSTGNIFPPKADGTPSEGGYLISDSDAAGGSDDIGSKAEVWAISPVFSTAGASQVWMHVNAEIETNNNGEALALLEGTADGGATWVPIWICVEPQRVQKDFASGAGTAEMIGGWPELGSASEFKTFSGVHGRWHVEFPDALVNKPQVRFRIGWFESADAWYIALDDLVVSADGPPMGSNVVLSENFDGGIPSTWKNTSLNGTPSAGVINGDGYQVWDTTILKDPSFPDEPLKLNQSLGSVDVDIVRFAETFGITLDMANPDPAVNPNGALDGRWLNMLAGGTYAMWQENFSLPAAGNYAANLDTPSLNLTNATAVYLDFLSEVLVGNASSNYNVQVSVNGGTTFTEIFNYHKALMDYAEGSYFTHHYLTVPQAAGQSNVIFRFHAEGQDPDQMEGFWVIDNVRVTSSTGGQTAVGEWSVF